METGDLQEMAELLYGDAVYPVVKSLTEQQKKDRNRRYMEDAAIATNAVGMVAGPAALYSAVRHRGEGGIPRDIATAAYPKMKQSNRKLVRAVGEKTEKVVGALNSPGSKKARIAAGAAGAGLIGLQAVNWGGDTLSTKLLNDQKKEKKKVAKSLKEVEEKGTEPKKLRAIKVGHKLVFESAHKAPLVARKVEEQVKKNSDILWHGEISKMDTDKRQVFGWASVIEVDGKPVVDHQEDIMELDVVEKAAYDYVVKSRKGGHQHRREGDYPVHVSDMIESFVVTPEKKAQMGLPEELPTGWWVGFQINDDEVWKSVKEGKLPGFSIHGSGVRTTVTLED